MWCIDPGEALTLPEQDQTGAERARYDASLASFMTEETRAGLWEAVDDVLSHGPLGEFPSQVTGLALGYVQSGKTTNIIGLAAGAADAGYRIIIAFLGSTNLLVDQNGKRIRDALIEGRRDYKWQEVTGLGKRDAGFYTLLGPLARNAQLKPDVYRGLPAVDSVG